MSDDLQRRQDVWTSYWRSGAAHSCGTSYGERYGGAISAFWEQVSRDTPEGARLLDLATGSGAIPRLWRGWRTVDAWDAVDLSTEPSPWMAAAGGVRFHGGVRTEALPFDDATFDLATSQFGLEYCELDRAVPEMLRVLRPTGAVALVLHHAGSRPVTLARAELEQLDWALGADGLVEACAAMLGPAAEAATPEGRARLAGDPKAESARLRFNAAQVAVRERVAGSEAAGMLVELRDTVGGLVQLAMKQGEVRARAALDGWTQALRDHRWRQDELCAHALGEPAAQALAASLQASGRRVVLETLSDGPHLMGWTLRATAG